MPVRVIAVMLMSVLLAACGSRSKEPEQRSGPIGWGPSSNISGPKNYTPPGKDGAPWWDVDVSKIADAEPTPHYGAYKAAPYKVLGKNYYPIQDASKYKEVGHASWYGTKFHGQATANGETYDLYGMTAAHKTLPLPSYVEVTNLDNGKKVILRVNDRGPFYSDRIIDLSFAAAKKLGYAETGTARVRVVGIDPNTWLAERGKAVPAAATAVASAQQQTQVAAIPQSVGQPLETYTPPPQQHAASVVPLEVESGKSAPLPGVYLQVGAFANPDAAQLLQDKLALSLSAPVSISSVARGQQVLHRVRLGPLQSETEATQLQAQLARMGHSAMIAK